MSPFRDVQTFVRAANRASRREDLRRLMDDFVPELGFDFYSLVQHVETQALGLGDFIHLVTFPEDWQQTVLTRGYFADDPVHVACQKTASGFLWSTTPQIIGVTARQREILEAAAGAGLGDGFAVPIHLPGELAASCSFGMKAGRDIPHDSLPAAQYVGCFAFEALRRIRMAGRGPRGAAPPKLSTRQLDCMVLAAGGRTDQQIAERLGISERTVHQHVEEAKHRYDASTRMLLVVRALFDGQLTFADIFRTLH